MCFQEFLSVSKLSNLLVNSCSLYSLEMILYKVSSNVPTFVSNFSNLSLHLSRSVWLNFVTFKEPTFGSLESPCCFSVSYFVYLCFNLYYFLSSASCDFRLIFFNFLEVYIFTDLSSLLFLINLFTLKDNYFTVLWWCLPYIDMNQPWVHTCPPIVDPSPTFLLTPSLRVVPEHWL